MSGVSLNVLSAKNHGSHHKLQPKAFAPSTHRSHIPAHPENLSVLTPHAHCLQQRGELRPHFRDLPPPCTSAFSTVPVQ
eukprot:2439668-Prymnesium_polylepis.1